jgi:hypothetical protein
MFFGSGYAENNDRVQSAEDKGGFQFGGISRGWHLRRLLVTKS